MVSITPVPHLDTREGLLETLMSVDREGWEGDCAGQLLSHVRDHIVRPQVISSGLSGPAASQAEATGWEVAWEILNRGHLREIENPWGWIWVAVRRAIQGEVMSALYLTEERKSWRAREGRDKSQECRPHVSLEQLLETGWERAASTSVRLQLGRPLQAVVGALVQVGWEPRSAHAVVEAVAATVTRHDVSSMSAQGWRTVANDLGVPPWQVRRVTVVLLGGPGWPGAMERMVEEGLVVLDDPAMRAALKSTANYFLPTPLLAARQATRAAKANPTRVAS